jgi:hypothetical protein
VIDWFTCHRSVIDHHQMLILKTIHQDIWSSYHQYISMSLPTESDYLFSFTLASDVILFPRPVIRSDNLFSPWRFLLSSACSRFPSTSLDRLLFNHTCDCPTVSILDIFALAIHLPVMHLLFLTRHHASWYSYAFMLCSATSGHASCDRRCLPLYRCYHVLLSYQCVYGYWWLHK